MDNLIGARAVVNIDGQEYTAILSALHDGAAAGYREVLLDTENKIELVTEDQIVSVDEGAPMDSDKLKKRLGLALPNLSSDSHIAKTFGRIASAQPLDNEFNESITLFNQLKDSNDANEVQTAVASAMQLLERPELLTSDPSEADLKAYIEQHAAPVLLARYHGETGDVSDVIRESANDAMEVDEMELTNDVAEDAAFLRTPNEQPRTARTTARREGDEDPQPEPLVHVTGMDALFHGVGSLFSAGASLGHSMGSLFRKRGTPGWLAPEVNRLARGELDALLRVVEAKSQAVGIATQVIMDDQRILTALADIDHTSNTVEAIEKNAQSYAAINDLLRGELSGPWDRSCELFEEAAEVVQTAQSKYEDLDSPHDFAGEMIDAMRQVQANGSTIKKLDPDSALSGLVARIMAWLEDAIANISARMSGTANGLQMSQKPAAKLRT